MWERLRGEMGSGDGVGERVVSGGGEMMWCEQVGMGEGRKGEGESGGEEG